MLPTWWAVRTGERFIPMLRAYTVFHASQMDGIPPIASPTLLEVSWRRPEAVDTIVANSGALVRVGGGQAFYSPGSDHIQMPPHAAFTSPEGFAATMLHELGHWTGAKQRLDRDMTGRFGSASYATEELRVEIASTLMCAELGVVSVNVVEIAVYLRRPVRSCGGGGNLSVGVDVDATAVS